MRESLKQLVSLVQQHYQTTEFIPLHEPRFDQHEKDLVIDCIDSTFVSNVGKYVDLLEQKLAAYTGAKHAIATVNGTSALHIALHLAGAGRDTEAREKLTRYAKQYGIEAIAIGNGTGGRELESMVRSLDLGIPVVMVNESGASVYSASEVAREEFGDYDLTVRGSVSIGRRLMDPLAELVKIDPKSIGVGQYQHDVDQNALKNSLDDVVMSCVNAVGVEVNTASKQLLTYVSGLGPQLAGNIVDYRNEHGPFSSRAALKQVPRLADRQSTAPRPEGVRTGRRVPAHSGRQKSAGYQRRSPGKLFPGRCDFEGSANHCCRPDAAGRSAPAN